MIRTMKNIILLFISGLFLFSVPFVHAEEDSVTVPYTITGDGAGNIKESLTGTLKFKKGEQSKEIVLTIKAGTTVEKDETFTVTLSATEEVTLGKNNTLTGTILNDDVPHLDDRWVQTDRSLSVEEGNTGAKRKFTFLISLDNRKPAELDFSVDYIVESDGRNGVDKDDFVGGRLPKGTLNFKVGDVRKFIVFEIKGDDKVEGTEGFTVYITSNDIAVTRDRSGKRGYVPGEIIDDEEHFVSIGDAKPAEQKEGDEKVGTFTFPITSNKYVNSSFTVPYTVSGDGITDKDFTDGKLSGTVTLRDGRSADLVLTVKDDSEPENDEKFTVTLGVSPEIRLGKSITASGTILDDDTPVVSIAAAEVKQMEGNVSKKDINFEVTLSAKTTEALQIPYTITGSGTNPADSDDFSQSLKGEMTIDAGSDKGTLSLEVKGDTVFEEDETFTVTLGAAPVGVKLGTNISATGSILNDDSLRHDLGMAPAAPAKLVEGGGAVFNFYITAVSNMPDQLVTDDLSISYEVTGKGIDQDDFVEKLTGTVEIKKGTNNGVVVLTIKDDKVVEENEEFTVTLLEKSFPSGVFVGDTPCSICTGIQTGTILNDDVHTVSIGEFTAVSIKEDAEKATFTFPVILAGGTLPKAFDVPYTISGPGIDDEDFEGGKTGTVTLGAGKTSANLTITVKDDDLVERDEKFTVTLTGGSFDDLAANDHSMDLRTSEQNTATGTILNDDNSAPVVKKKIPDQEITAGEELSIDVYGAFSDADEDVLTIKGEGLPKGAVLVGIQLTEKFFMTRDWLSDIGEHTITITADDNKGGEVSTTFKLTVKSYDQPPVVQKKIADLEATVGKKISDIYAQGRGTDDVFSDPDSPSYFNVTVSGHSKVKICSTDPSESIICSYPAFTEADVGDHTIIVTAKDLNGGEVSTTFKLMVKPKPAAAKNKNLAPSVVINFGSNNSVDSEGSYSFRTEVTPRTIRNTYLSSIKCEGGMEGGSVRFVFGAAGGSDRVGTFKAPKNNTGKVQNCTIKVSTDDVGGKKVTPATLVIKVNPAKPDATALTTACPSATPIKCPDGSCKTTASQCLTTSTAKACPAATPIKCADGTCKLTAAECTTTTTAQCPVDSPVQCPDGTCKATATECPTATKQKEDTQIEISLSRVSVESDEGKVGFGPTEFIFTVVLSSAASEDVKVNYTVKGSGTNPANGQDFDGGKLPQGEITIPVGETQGIITIKVKPDDENEKDEEFTVTLSQPSTGLTIGNASINGKIRDGDGSPSQSLITNNQCSPACQNGGVCDESLTCACSSGYSGLSCEIIDSNLVDDKLTDIKPRKEFKLVEGSRKFLLLDSRLISGSSPTQVQSLTTSVTAITNFPRALTVSGVPVVDSDNAPTTIEVRIDAAGTDTLSAVLDGAGAPTSAFTWLAGFPAPGQGALAVPGSPFQIISPASGLMNAGAVDIIVKRTTDNLFFKISINWTDDGGFGNATLNTLSGFVCGTSQSQCP